MEEVNVICLSWLQQLHPLKQQQQQKKHHMAAREQLCIISLKNDFCFLDLCL